MRDDDCIATVLAADLEWARAAGAVAWQTLSDERSRRIAGAVAAEVRGRFGGVLREHYLAGITCDGAQERDNPVCGCSRVFLGWHPSVGEAREAWIRHVMEVAGGDREGANHA